MRCEQASTGNTVRSRGPVRQRATVKVPSAAERELEDRLALLVCALAKGRETELLSGLVEKKRGPAMQIAEEVAQLSSSVRQARLAHLFSERLEAAERTRRLLEEASPCLEQAVFAALPPYLRPVAQKREVAGPPASSVLAGFAARLVKEATR